MFQLIILPIFGGYRLKITGPHGEVIRDETHPTLDAANHALEEALSHIENLPEVIHTVNVIPDGMLKMPGWR